MSWQDYAITITTFLISLSLIPQVYAGFKEKRGHIKLLTSIPTALGLIVLAVCYFSLGLTLSGFVSIFMTLLWSLLVLQRIMYTKP